MVRLLGNGLVSYFRPLTVLLRCCGVQRETARWGAVKCSRAGIFQPDRNSFNRLCVAQISLHSLRTFLNPRKLKRRNPRPSLMYPKTGSTICFRILYGFTSIRLQLISHLLQDRTSFRQPIDANVLALAVLLSFCDATCRSIPCKISAVTFAELQ